MDKLTPGIPTKVESPETHRPYFVPTASVLQEDNKATSAFTVRQEQRYICHECEQTFSATKGTLFYRAQGTPGTDAAIMLLVVA